MVAFKLASVKKEVLVIYIVQMHVPVSRYSWFIICAIYSLFIVHLFCSLFDYLFCFLFHWFFAYLLSKRKRAILILNRVQVFRSCKAEEVTCYLFKYPLYLFKYSTSSSRVNKHHTADSTDFVLVLEAKDLFYHHRHSGIDETNILHIDNHSSGRDR